MLVRDISCLLYRPSRLREIVSDVGDNFRYMDRGTTDKLILRIRVDPNDFSMTKAAAATWMIGKRVVLSVKILWVKIIILVTKSKSGKVSKNNLDI